MIAVLAASLGPPTDGEGAAATVLRFEEYRSLRIRGRDEVNRKRIVVVHVVGDSVREDRDDQFSFLFLPRRRALIRLDHELRLFQRYATPVRIDEILDAEWMRSTLAAMVGEVQPPDVTVADTAERAEYDRRLNLEGTLGTKDYVVDAWLTSRDDLPTLSYLALVRNVESLSPLGQQWSDLLAAEGRFPVRLRVQLGDEKYQRLRDRRLVSVRRDPIDPDVTEKLFEIPDGYRQAPAYCLQDLTVGSDPACRELSGLD